MTSNAKEKSAYEFNGAYIFNWLCKLDHFIAPNQSFSMSSLLRNNIFHKSFAVLSQNLPARHTMNALSDAPVCQQPDGDSSLPMLTLAMVSITANRSVPCVVSMSDERCRTMVPCRCCTGGVS